MCIICIELAKQAMSPLEARRALGEMSVKLDKAHVAEVEREIQRKLVEAEQSQKP